MPAFRYEPVFELWRGDALESLHTGAIAVVDSGGRLLAYYADPATVAFLRSSAKPFQAMPFLEHGGQAAYSLTPREIALICASHSGTDEHLAVVRSLQARIGIQESDLLCGVHAPYHAGTSAAMLLRGEAPTPNRNNCSGKHTGMLAYVRMKNLPVQAGPGELTYIDPDHPIQKEIIQALAEMCGLPVEEVVVGTDGCSAPTFAVPLYNAALGYARLVDPRGLPGRRAEVCQTITQAMTSNPEMVGGPDSFDTHLMKATGGKVLCKGGAEGFQALGLLPEALGPGSPGLGIAFKIADGDLGGHSRPQGDPTGHVRPAVALEVLRQLGVLSAAELASLADYGPGFPLYNWRKWVVGQGKPCFQLER
jgi:L-asparaginase II